MPNGWNIIIRQVASRMNAITGSVIPDSENQYKAVAVSQSNMDDASYNYSLIQDACVDAEQMIAQVIGQTANHPWRNLLTTGDLSASSGAGLSSGSNIYTVSGTPITNVIGIGRVRKAGTGAALGEVCTERPLEDIVRWTRLAPTNAEYGSIIGHFYRIVDNLVFHTVTGGVVIEYFAYDRAITEAAIKPSVSTPFLTGDPIFPGSAFPCYMAGALSLLLKEEEYSGQCQYYGGVFKELLEQIAAGYGTTDPSPRPTPVKGAESV